MADRGDGEELHGDQMRVAKARSEAQTDGWRNEDSPPFDRNDSVRRTVSARGRKTRGVSGEHVQELGPSLDLPRGVDRGAN